ncbi:MAG TPA: DUF2085 domain-containing protein [Acidobacteriota bacterium]|nr:DUF2085 domain-containing protein [Acidobacteriota bacterium]
MQRKLAAVLLIGGSLLWIGLILASPLARAQGWSAASWIDLFFQQICHQIPERSFHLDGHQLPVCHRCLGIYLGFLGGALALPFWHSLRRRLLAQPRLLLVGFGLMALDVFLLPNTWWSRLATGFFAAFPVAVFVEMAFRQLLPATFSIRQPLQSIHARE